ncbi:hypothetical protein [Lewinella sp. IMCC34191]|uniref:hypothetical protein n=1 Tax=Lewinella sp. IMCC34191 TaxID=2259172 RepID=UPI0013005DC7|nr:hypothetical protein [Lewinella sp. IMCC34191]
MSLNSQDSSNPSPLGRYGMLSPRRFGSGLPQPGMSFRASLIERTLIRRSAVQPSRLALAYDRKWHASTVWRIIQVNALATSVGEML